MKVYFPKYLQRKATFFGLEVYDFFILSGITFSSTSRVFDLDSLQFGLVIGGYILFKMWLKRFPRAHFRQWFVGLGIKDMTLFYIKNGEKK